VLVEDVDGDVDAAGDHPGGEPAVGVGADLPVEDERDLVGPAGAEVVGDQRLEERPGAAGLVKDQGAGDLDLAHRALPPVARGPVRRRQGQGQAGQPPLEEHPDRCGAEPVAGLLQPLGVVGRGEAVGELGEADPKPGRLLLVG